MATIITSVAMLRKAVAQIKKASYFSWDTETTGLNIYLLNDVGMSFAWRNPGKRLCSIYIPFRHREGNNISVKTAAPLLQKIFSNKKAIAIGHNAKFDINVSRKDGMIVENFGADTLTMAWLVDENRKVGLKDLAVNELGVDPSDIIKYKDFKVKEGQGDRIPIEVLGPYCCKDSEYTLRLYEKFLPTIDREFKKYFYTVEVPLTQIVAEMEWNGAPIDDELRKKKLKFCEKKARSLQKAIYSMAGGELNINSTQQLRELLYKKMKLPVLKETAVTEKQRDKGVTRGNASTDVTTLMALANQGHKLPAAILKFRTYSKSANTFLKNLEPTADGCIHGSFKQNGTTSGRFSSSNPNCFTGDTEILTLDGWIPFEDLQSHLPTRVAQYNLKTSEINFTDNYQTVEQESSDVWNIKSDTFLDFNATGDHDFIIDNRKTGERKKVPLRDIKPDYRLPCAGSYVGGGVRATESEISLICAVQADGSVNSSGGISFTFVKKRKIIRLTEALNYLNIKYSTIAKKSSGRNKKSTVIYIMQGALVLGKELVNWKEFNWGILNFDRETLDLFVKEIMFWDGCLSRQSMYSSSIKKNADIVQAVVALSNKRARLRTYNNSNERSSPNYQVDVSHYNYCMTTNSELKKLRGTHSVYCVTVPQGNIVIRRNKNVLITGNCQNMPNDPEVAIREVFVPFKNEVLVVADYSQIELRIMAHYSSDPIMLDAYRTGKDIHAITAARVFHKKPDEVTKQERQLGKTLNFAFVYGGSYFTLINMQAKRGINVDEDEAKENHRAYRELYEGLFSFIERAGKGISKTGHIMTLAGRVRRLPEALYSTDDHEMRKMKFAAIRGGINVLGQGGGADIIKIAMVKLWKPLKELKVRTILQVHDELVMSCPKKNLKKAQQVIKDVMTSAVRLRVPLEISMNTGTNWKESK